ncbi:MAG: hypothetical protein RXR43_15425 [Sulfolobus sp.]
MAFFIYTFYEGIIGDLVQPYFTAVIVGFSAILFALVYTLLKRYKGEIGESTIIYYILENKEGEIKES